MKNLLKKFFTVSGLMVLVLFVFIGTSLAITADECEKKIINDEFRDDEAGLKECDTIINNVTQQKRSEGITLVNEIDRLDRAVAITTVKILLSIKEIEVLEKEIASLNGKIGILDLSLDQMSEILIKRIAETYKKGKVNMVGLFLLSNSFSDFISRYKYLKVVQLHDRNLMLQMETARTNFEDQKDLKEEKQKELELAKSKLENQKALLAQQKAAKDNLLAITKNDERRYQQLLAQARTQLSRFKVFTASQGGASILSGQTKCDSWGCYYSQRDSLWGDMPLGGTTYLMKDSGCFITSVAMLASHSGRNIKPGDIAQLSAAITSGGDLRWSFIVNSVNVSIVSASKNDLDQKLSEGKPVIAGLYCNPTPSHFIVIKSKAGSDYIMNDPFLENGSNRMLSEKYNVSDICTLRLVSF